MGRLHWQLTASAVGAALLALAASGLARARLADVMAMAVVGDAPVAPKPDLPPSLPPGPGADRCAVSDAAIGAGTVAVRGAEPVPYHSRAGRQRARPPRAPASRRPDDLAQALADGIRRIGDGRYQIRRAALDQALNNLAALARWVRVAPEVRAGRPVGFRLSAVAPDGPFAKLGLRDEDVLVSVNRIEITTPDRVLDAYGKLRAARHLVLGLLRAGQERQQEYTIR